MRGGMTALALILLAVALDVWTMLSGRPTVALAVWPLSGTVQVAPAMVPLVGFVAGFAAAGLSFGVYALVREWSGRSPGTVGSISPGPVWAAAIGAVWIGLVLLLLGAVIGHELRPMHAAVLLVCGSLAIVGAIYAFESLRNGNSVEFSSYWGGLGGGMGGWRISPVTTTIVLTIIFLGALIAIATGVSPILDKPAPATVQQPSPAPAPGRAEGKAG